MYKYTNTDVNVVRNGTENQLIDAGLLSLWRGNSATMARIIPYAAIQFTAHEQWKHVLKTDRPDASTGMRFVSGSLAGVTAQSLTYPLDLARARMAVTPRHMYKSLAQVFVHLGRDRQPRVFYKGFTATILGVIPYAGVSFCTYETLKQTHRGNISVSTLHAQNHAQLVDCFIPTLEFITFVFCG